MTLIFLHPLIIIHQVLPPPGSISHLKYLQVGPFLLIYLMSRNGKKLIMEYLIQFTSLPALTQESCILLPG